VAYSRLWIQWIIEVTRGSQIDFCKRIISKKGSQQNICSLSSDIIHEKIPGVKPVLPRISVRGIVKRPKRKTEKLKLKRCKRDHHPTQHSDTPKFNPSPLDVFQTLLKIKKPCIIRKRSEWM